jgi:S-adenosylmethionine-dependent methyltransferase
MTDPVQAYYDMFDEWSRLESPAGKLEWERTLSYISARLPQRADVLDIGGGPGRYTIALAEAGHRVSLIDPSGVQIQAARSRVAAAGVQDRIPAISTGDIRDLSRFEAETFDGALALGPFYHLVDGDERLAAALELFRVLRPRGQAFVSIIPRLSGLAGLVQRGAIDPEQVPASVLEQVAATGVFVNPTERGFQSGYYPEIPEIEDLFATAGFEQLDLLSIRALAFGSEAELQRISALSPASAAAFNELLEATCRDAAVVALSGHAMLTFRRPSHDAA